MTWLRIVHETIYRYDQPVAFGSHRLVLRPREGHDIRVEEMILDIAPAYDLEWSRDVFGNSVATVAFLAEADALVIKNTLLLRQTAGFPRHTDRPVRPPAYPLAFSNLEQKFTDAYRDSAYAEDAGEVAAWVRAQIDADSFTDAEALAAAVNERIRAAIKYQTRQTKGVQPPAQTLKLGSGSCRDLATLLMESWRALGFPARFASGYLDCVAAEAGEACMHAWAEAYLPEVGWIGFDPTLGSLTSGRHVVTGVSHHPRGVMPVVGTFYGEKERYLGMEVTVKTERVERPASTICST
jgi:transglutaminase-like putative cysteine protease